MPKIQREKTTDSRYAAYIRVHGDESWELDALEPDTLAALVRDHVLSLRDKDKWDAKLEEENEHKRLLTEVSRNWPKLTRKL